MIARYFRKVFVPLVLAGALAASCSEDAQPGGGLLLRISRDEPLPMDRVDLTITSGDKVLHEVRYRVPEEAALPTTFGITSNGDPTASVTITVTGWDGKQPLDRRDAIVTQVPTNRIALLKVVLSARCSPQVMLVDGDAVSACGEASTCDPSTGDCTSAEVDANKLPTFDPEHPDFGEGGASGSGGEAGAATAGSGNAAAGEGGTGGIAGQSGMSGQSGAAGQGGQGPMCEAGFDDCDDDPSDCETVIDSDIDNCGECGKSCPEADGHGWCDAGTCTVTTCEAPLADCNLEPSDGCEIDTTASNANCLGCNQPCPVETPFCTPTGCSDHRDIKEVHADTKAFYWDEVPEGEAYRRVFSYPLRLTTPYREGDQGRVLVVGVVGAEANLKSDSLKYAGVQMGSAQPAEHGTSSQIRIYSLQEGELPKEPGDYPLELTVNAIPAGGVVMQMLELKNVRMSVGSASTAPDDCSPMLLGLAFSAPGAWTYQLAAARDTQGLGPSIYPYPGFPTAQMVLDDEDFYLNIGNTTFVTDGGVTLSWTSEVCSNGTGVVAAVAFARMGNDPIALP